MVTQKRFYKSHFIKYYRQTDRRPEKEVVINSLHGLQYGNFVGHKVTAAIKNGPDEHDVIRTYSSNIKYGSHTFYTYVNNELCKDDEQTILKLMPLIRRATSQINYKSPSEDCIVYRGMELSNLHKSYFKVDTVFRFPGFTSTSKSKIAAKDFGNTLFKIHIPAGCKQVRDIANVSYFPGEQEYLFSPYSLFQVTQVTIEFIVLKAIDNLSKAGMDAPEPSWQLDMPGYLPKNNKKLVKKKKDTSSKACIIL